MADSERRGKLSIDPRLLDAMNVLTEEPNRKVFGTLFRNAPQYCNELARRLGMNPDVVTSSLYQLRKSGLVEKTEEEMIDPLFTPTNMGISLGILAHSGECSGITFTRGR